LLRHGRLVLARTRGGGVLCSARTLDALGTLRAARLALRSLRDCASIGSGFVGFAFPDTARRLPARLVGVAVRLGLDGDLARLGRRPLGCWGRTWSHHRFGNIDPGALVDQGPADGDDLVVFGD